jgi:predicted RNase H-like HicB family nuclease
MLVEVEMNISDYRIVIDRLSAADGGGYLASIPDLPGCVSDGETQEEAIRNVRDAMSAWIDEARRLGRSVPEPSLVGDIRPAV